MSRLSAAIVSIAFALTSAVAAQATTIASLTVSEGTWAVEEGNSLTITGDFAGDFSGFAAANPTTPLPLVFGAEFSLNGTPIFDGEVGPVPLSPVQLILSGFSLGGALDDLTGGAFSAGTSYIWRGYGRSNPADVLSFGDFDLFFSYTRGSATRTTVAGDFTAIITQTNPNGPSLSDRINASLAQLNLGGTPLNGFTFPSQASGTYAANFTIGTAMAAVPLPAGLPLLGAGLFGLALFRRRRQPV